MGPAIRVCRDPYLIQDDETDSYWLQFQPTMDSASIVEENQLNSDRNQKSKLALKKNPKKNPKNTQKI